MTFDPALIDEEHNELVNRAELRDRMTALLRDLMMRSGRTRLSMSTRDISELQAAQDDTESVVDTYFGMMIEQANRRRENLIRYRRATVISLGEDCFSRTIATHWGLKRSSKLGEKSHPFDLAVHPLASIVRLLVSDFDSYMEVPDLFFDAEKKITFDRRLSISFNHEVGEQYSANNFDLLRSTYERRIANFRRDLETAQNPVFLFHNSRSAPRTSMEINELMGAVRTKCAVKPYLFIAIENAGEPTSGQSPVLVETVGACEFLIRAAYPFKGYTWHNPAHAFSRAGYEFERGVVDVISAVMDERLPRLASDQ